MSERVRGRALIININTFFHTGDVRNGSKVDYENLRKLFINLRFDIAKSVR